MGAVVAAPLRPLRRAITIVAALGCVALGACASPSEASTGSLGDPTNPTAVPSQPDRDPIRTGSAESGSAGSGSATTLWTEQPSDIEVVVVGDSLTVSAADEIRAALGQVGIGLIEVDAVEGRRMVEDLDDKPSGLSAIDGLESNGNAAAVDIWVIALGTNDVGAQASPDRLNDDISTVLSRIGPSQQVAWIDVFIESRDDASAEFGAQVRELAIERGDMVVGDWYHHAQTDGMLVGDGVHLTSAGRAEFADTIAATVARLIPGRSAGDPSTEPSSPSN